MKKSAPVYSKQISPNVIPFPIVAKPQKKNYSSNPSMNLRETAQYRPHPPRRKRKRADSKLKFSNPRPLKAASRRQPSVKKAVGKKVKGPGALFIYGIRLLIFGIGIGAIAGTALSAFDPASPLLSGINFSVDQKEGQQVKNGTSPTKPVKGVELGASLPIPAQIVQQLLGEPEYQELSTGFLPLILIIITTLTLLAVKRFRRLAPLKFRF
ncbi:MAG: hypothetical protein HC796_02060 [Synechococcaceae cyanobacterium RL_1_2]|nr:hypothetical protein [Synechococcaceae cyanobacterium RL_1_2]